MDRPPFPIHAIQNVRISEKNTLNLDLNITEYVTVNFDAVIAAVDAMNGITIDIDSSELKYLNDYIKKNLTVSEINKYY